MVRAGKSFCTHCPPPRSPINDYGNLVLGVDSEQTKRAAEELRRSRQVSKLSPFCGVYYKMSRAFNFLSNNCL
jgi:hypothetical protein